ncbi:MAG: hypothetical protein JNK65_05210 [Deltaproteobacteria bacterium]|nr:hypothetical protein [Deltaproteobacteria bacterium]
MKKIVSKLPLKPISFAGLFSLMLIQFACSGGGGPGGAVSPLGSTGPGGAGAPPISIPGPEALNMSAISVTGDGAGTATVNVSPGAAQPGRVMEVRNIGDVAWYRPIQEMLIRTAYAIGEIVTHPVDSNGATNPATFTIPAKTGDWLTFRQCAKENPAICGDAFKLEVKAGVNPGSNGTKITIDGKGNIYLIQNEKKRFDWMSWFIPSAYAQERTVTPVDATSLEGFTSATCSAPEFSSLPAPTPKDDSKILPIRWISAFNTNVIEIARINGDPQNPNRGVITFGESQIAAYVSNKLYIISKATPDAPVVTAKFAYPSEIVRVQEMGPTLLVFLDGKNSAPKVYFADKCAQMTADANLFKDIEQVIDQDSIDSRVSSQYVMTAKTPHGYCVLNGSFGGEGGSVLREKYCQRSLLSEIQMLLGDVNSWVALSPETKELIYLPAGESNVQRITIPQATNPVTFALGSYGIFRSTDLFLTVLDSPSDRNSKLIPFELQNAGTTYRFVHRADMQKDLSYRAIALKYVRGTEHGFNLVSYPAQGASIAPQKFEMQLPVTRTPEMME